MQKTTSDYKFVASSSPEREIATNAETQLIDFKFHEAYGCVNVNFNVLIQFNISNQMFYFSPTASALLSSPSHGSPFWYP
jgi:hypothetical protein